MAKHGGYNGQMPGSMQNLMKQAQRMQQKMADMQKDLENQTVEATSGGGAVHVVVNGRKELVSVEIQKEAVDPDDVEMLQDLIVAAVNEAMRNADAMVNQSMSQITGGLNLPGGLF
ncbi:MAG: YbaB/EbfC family nucleoid-associated protein [Firmicutes bacterium]|jgi:DNA-binding YbaB/EbfC family protein|nr:YbaB/EbfC family nucleoid-associated protein [Bacillota bacterium]MBQ5959359.1 YbaB/EbfC family nucleoid-associated protein [Bacillota bacterium]